MHYKKLHAWEVSARQAIAIQNSLAAKTINKRLNVKKVTTIAGVDVSFRHNLCCGAVCVFSYPGLKLIEEKTAISAVNFPYIPTLLTFREGPAVLKCFTKINNTPDVVLFDGQGIAHPRKMGLATHLGIWLTLPAVGCAKTPLYGTFSMPAAKKGSYSLIRQNEKTIGAVLRTRDRIKPIFVSPGHMIGLTEAIQLVLGSSLKYRIPEPLRAAHTSSKATLKQFFAVYKSRAEG
jgi:deoxyribonuclease V